MTSVVNIAGYRFVPLADLPERRQALRSLCVDLGLKGTILLSDEGINLFLAGNRHSIDSFLESLRNDEPFRDLTVRESLSDHQPFTRMLVRLKREIIAFGVDGIDPRNKPAPRLEPQTLRRWLDEGRDIALLDVRNDYEVRLGTFRDAQTLPLDHFRKFPEMVAALPQELRDRPLVTFCTGGIRCEKAAPLLQQAGFENVYQLDGGILRYFQECGAEHYEGECFVFDKRVALDADLRETGTTQCYACQAPLTPQEQQAETYVPGKACPNCADQPVPKESAH